MPEKSTCTTEDHCKSVLGDPAKHAWIALITTNARLYQEIDRRLSESCGVNMDIYDVLLNLEIAPNMRLRMSELAEAVLFSRSGITRLIDRLERLGWVIRESCPADRRSLYAALTPAGLNARKGAWPIYQEAIQELFASKMSSEEAENIAMIFERMTPNVWSKLT